MNIPRGPVIRAGELSREWDRELSALAGGMPGTPPAAELQREWLRWFGVVGGGAFPRAPLYGADGMVSREWRAWLEAI